MCPSAVRTGAHVHVNSRAQHYMRKHAAHVVHVAVSRATRLHTHHPINFARSAGHYV